MKCEQCKKNVDESAYNILVMDKGSDLFRCVECRTGINNIKELLDNADC